MKILAVFFLTLTAHQVLAFGQQITKKYFCKTEDQRNAIYLELDEVNQRSLGRISHPFTTDLDSLKLPNADQSQFTRVNVKNVKLERLQSGRPFCADCYTFNMSPYSIPNGPQQVLEKTKSILSRIRIPQTSQSAIMLKVFVSLNSYGSPVYYRHFCERLN
ncbi:MAG: hypothetical protein ACK5V3_17935 [Bdellovibrionales bacterium]